jgi:hypothetical protein
MSYDAWYASYQALNVTSAILADPAYSDEQKVHACILFLQSIPLEHYVEYPQAVKPVVAGAFKHGASWKLVADAAQIDIAEAKRRWADVATPSTR